MCSLRDDCLRDSQTIETGSQVGVTVFLVVLHAVGVCMKRTSAYICMHVSLECIAFVSRLNCMISKGEGSVHYSIA